MVLSEKVWVAVISGVFGLILVVVKWLLPYLSNSKSPISEDKIDFKLIEHPIFSRIDFILSGIDYSLEFSDRGRYLLIRDVIEQYLTSIKSELFELAGDIDNKEINKESYNIHDYNMITLNKIINKYKDLNNYENLNLESKETLVIFINKFQQWHSERIGFLIERSAEISGSNFYKRDRVKVAVLFDLYTGVLTDTLHDAKNSLYSLNGELVGKQYRDECIGGYHNER